MSLIDPFDISESKDFNIWFYIIAWFFIFYNKMAWQGGSAYNSCTLTAHDAKMANVVGQFKEFLLTLGIILMPLVALTIMHHPKFAGMATSVSDALMKQYPDQPALQTQMRTVFVLKQILPVGLFGAFAAAMLGFFLSTHNTYMHSWGSIFIQDVVMPLRKKPFPPKQHIRLLRLSIVFVATSAYLLSFFFPLKDYIVMVFQITGAIFLGGAGSVIIGGLYWKRGSTAGAFAAMITGSTFALTAIILQYLWEDLPFLVSISPTFPVNGQVLAFFAALASIIAYISFSLLIPAATVNMDKLLHRGEYAVQQEQKHFTARTECKAISRFWKWIGVNREFSKADRFCFLVLFCHGMLGLGGFGVLLTLKLCGIMNVERWLYWWRLNLWINLVLGIIGVAWVSVGGLIDLRKMFARLAVLQRDVKDDGWVEDSQNLADEKLSMNLSNTTNKANNSKDGTNERK